MIDMMMINKIKVVDAQMSTAVILIFNFLKPSPSALAYGYRSVPFSLAHRLLHMGTGQFPFRLRIGSCIWVQVSSLFACAY
jgi:hypothetical protein